MSRPRFAELFAGAGGLSMGLERAGFECAWHAEWNDDARAVLSARWPDVPLYGDVTALDGKALTAAHGPVDLLTGGSPCQDLSVAGKRAGMTEGSGTRSSLFFEQMRIWDECGVDLCLWENVDGARSSNDGKDFGAVLRAFVGAAIAVPSDGWRSAGVAAGPRGVAAWRVLDAQYFGVPQRRRRVFVLGTRAGRVDPAEVLSLSESLRGDSPSSREAWEGTTDDAGERIARTLIAGGRETGPHGSLDGDNLVVAFTQDSDSLVSRNVSQSLKVGTGLDIGQPPCIVAFDTTQITSKANRSNPQLGDPCHPLAAAAHPPTVVAIDGEGNATGDVSGTLSAHHSSHNRGAVCLTGEVTHALTHEGHDASEDGTGRGTPIVARCVTAGEGQRNDWETCTLVVDDVAHALKAAGNCKHRADSETYPVQHGIPRRLTPRECERLMSWPDDHTLVPRNAKFLSDSARYRLCGNGVASVHTHWIGWRLAMELAR